jgi:hypothetical protein
MPGRHDVRPSDVLLRRLHGALAAAAERGPKDFAELLLVPGIGARTVLALALAAEVIHGAPCRFTDPARFSLAHGGKDRHPFPVPLRVYDRTLAVLRQAVDRAHLGDGDRLAAVKSLDAEARRLEAAAQGGPGVAEVIAREREASTGYGGMSVFGPEVPPPLSPTLSPLRGAREKELKRAPLPLGGGGPGRGSSCNDRLAPVPPGRGRAGESRGELPNASTPSRSVPAPGTQLSLPWR